MQDYSKILQEAYNQFLLPLGGKKIPTPYRINEYGKYQKIGPEFQGKSSPQVLTKTASKLAKEQKFNLNRAKIEDIRNFLIKNELGIDCSGFAYRMIDALVKKVKGKPLTAFGLPHVGRTYLSTLVGKEFAKPVKNLSEAKPGDIIILDGTTRIKNRLFHGLIVLEHKNKVITYAHSSKREGIKIEKAINYKLPEKFGIYRLKML